MKYWLTAALFLAIGTSHSYAQALADKSRLSVYESVALDTSDTPRHVIVVDLADRIVTSAQTRAQAEAAGAGMKFIRQDRGGKDPPDVREWFEAGTCGIQASAMIFAVPPAGKRSVDWEDWTFVAAKIDLEPPQNVVVAVKRDNGAMIQFSYDTNRGVYKFILYNPDEESGVEYKLVSGPGLLADCLSKRPN
jgi:hypothetical protein